jgi:hypothetical protein
MQSFPGKQELREAFTQDADAACEGADGAERGFCQEYWEYRYDGELLLWVFWGKKSSGAPSLQFSFRPSRYSH